MNRAEQREAYEELIREVKRQAAEQVQRHRIAIKAQERRVQRLYHRAMRELAREDASEPTPLGVIPGYATGGNAPEPDNSSPKYEVEIDPHMVPDETRRMTKATMAVLSGLLARDAERRGVSKQQRIVDFNNFLSKMENGGAALHDLTEAEAQTWVEMFNESLERSEARGQK